MMLCPHSLTCLVGTTAFTGMNSGAVVVGVGSWVTVMSSVWWWMESVEFSVSSMGVDEMEGIEIGVKEIVGVEKLASLLDGEGVGFVLGSSSIVELVVAWMRALIVEFLFGLSVGDAFAGGRAFAGGKMLDVSGVMRLLIVGVLFAAGIVRMISVVDTSFITPLLTVASLIIVVEAFVVVVVRPAAEEPSWWMCIVASIVSPAVLSWPSEFGT